MRVVPKDRSPLMKFFAQNILSRGGIVDSAQFMERFSTTIYLPFRGPVSFVNWADETQNSRTLCSRIMTLAHEAQHVAQMGSSARSRRAFSTGYVMSGRYRAKMEVEAYKLTIALASCVTWEDGQCGFAQGDTVSDEQIRRAEAAAEASATALESYGLSPDTLERAQKELRLAAQKPLDGLNCRAGRLLMRTDFGE